MLTHLFDVEHMANNSRRLIQERYEQEKGKPYVYVLTKEKPQTFNRREIKTGMSDGINIQVLSGLKVGDKVRGNQSQKTE